MHFKMPNFLKNRKLWLATLLIFAASFLAAPNVFASAGDWAGEVVGSIIYVFIWALGLVLILVMKGLILIASYQNFISSGAVQEGWTVVRDLSNMFFVVILLVIAFSTILHLENYSYKKWLPKLILMAVLINFSKTICGLLIDVAQIIMLTFVNAFKDVAGGNLIEMLGIREIVTLAEGSDSVGFWQIVGAYVLGLIYMIIALVVITTMMMMLVMRLVMIWIYVVLSPLAYLLAAFPGGAQYASQWWSEFIKNLIVGPVIAFFIWLSFAALQTGNYNDVGSVGTANISAEQEAFSGSIAKVDGASTPSMGTQASTPGVLIKFVIGIGMLIGGLKVAQQIGGAAGSVAGKGMGKLAAMGAATAAFGKKWGGKVATGDNYLARKTMKAAKFDFRPMALSNAIKTSFENAKKKDEFDIRDQGERNLTKGGVVSVLGGIGAGQGYGDAYLSWRGAARAVGEVTGFNSTRRQRYQDDLSLAEENLKQKEKEFSPLMSHDMEANIQVKINQGIADVAAYNQKMSDNQNAISAIDIIINKLQGKVDNNKASSDEIKKLREYKADRKNLENDNSTLLDKKNVVQDDINKNQNILNDARANNRIVSNSDYQSKKDDITKAKSEVSNAKILLARALPPRDLEGRANYRSEISQAKKKFDEISEPSEKLTLFEDAVKRKDRTDMVALMESLMSDVNFNELLLSRGYNQDGRGMIQFLHNEENEYGKRNGLDIKGLDEQSLLKIQNDLSVIAESTGQWTFAKTVGVDAGGSRYSTVKRDSNGNWDDSEQVISALTDLLKNDPQKLMTSLPRFAFGGNDVNGNFKLANLGKALALALDRSQAFQKQGNRMRPNLAMNLSFVIDDLEAAGVSPEGLNVIKTYGGNASGGIGADSLVEELISKNKFN